MITDYTVKNLLKSYTNFGPHTYQRIQRNVGLNPEQVKGIMEGSFFPDYDLAVSLYNFVKEDTMTVTFSRFERV